MKTAAVDLSDISLSANIPEGDAYMTFLLSPTGSLLLLSGNVSFQQSWDVYLQNMVLCVVVGFLGPRENKGVLGHLSFNTASATDLQCGFRLTISIGIIEYTRYLLWLHCILYSGKPPLLFSYPTCMALVIFGTTLCLTPSLSNYIYCHKKQ